MTVFTFDAEVEALTLSFPSTTLRLNKTEFTVKAFHFIFKQIILRANRSSSSIDNLDLVFFLKSALLKRRVRFKMTSLSLFLGPVGVVLSEDVSPSFPATFPTSSPSLPGVYPDDD